MYTILYRLGEGQGQHGRRRDNMSKRQWISFNTYYVLTYIKISKSTYLFYRMSIFFINSVALIFLIYFLRF